MFLRHHVFLVVAISAAAAFVLAGLLIYLTPLKVINLIPPQMHEITPLELSQAYAAHPEDYMLIDVRNVAQYDGAHVPGSISIPAANLTEEYLSLPRRGKQLVLICGDGRLAEVSYGFLQFEGFMNLLHLTGGVNNWIAAGLPVVSSTSSATSATTTSV